MCFYYTATAVADSAAAAVVVTVSAAPAITRQSKGFVIIACNVFGALGYAHGMHVSQYVILCVCKTCK